MLEGKCTSTDQIPPERRPFAGCQHTGEQVIADVCLFHKIARARRAWRFRDLGSLALDRVKLSFVLDPGSQMPVDVGRYLIRESNQLIEEFMLLANQLVARQLVEVVGPSALLRRHPPPDEERSEEMAEFMTRLGFPINVDSAGDLHKSLRALEGQETEDGLSVRRIVEWIMTKSMMPAEYFAVKESTDEFWHHYALSFDVYTHFTSPIRRYADCIVHRQLTWSISSEEYRQKHPLKAPDQVQTVADHCNYCKLRATKAQDASSLVYLCVLLQNKPRMVVAYVSDMGSKSLTIVASKYGIERRLKLSENEDIAEVKMVGEVPTGKLEIKWKNGSHSTMRVMDSFLVKMSMKPTTPIDVLLDLVPPGSEETLDENITVDEEHELIPLTNEVVAAMVDPRQILDV
eukprot:GABV01000365.1.p1 GENE.GABV01000365.1~~GABV01000365.1.p1  ORF type:complete len:403 (+),score=170.10 GABV01000365.1:181-1389(+)